MWYVAPLSKIQGFVKTKLIEALGNRDNPTTFAKALLLPLVSFVDIMDKVRSICWS